MNILFVLLFLTTPVFADMTKVDDTRVEITDTVVEVKVVSLDDLLNRKERLDLAISNVEKSLTSLQDELVSIELEIAEAKALGVKTADEVKAVKDK